MIEVHMVRVYLLRKERIHIRLHQTLMKINGLRIVLDCQQEE